MKCEVNGCLEKNQVCEFSAIGSSCAAKPDYECKHKIEASLTPHLGGKNLFTRKEKTVETLAMLHTIRDHIVKNNMYINLGGGQDVVGSEEIINLLDNLEENS